MITAAFYKKAKVSCFAYGQTGSGKTYTMMGDPNAKDLKCPGMYLLSSIDVFQLLQKTEFAELEIWVSFYEIYCNKLFDLLNNKNVLQAREDGKGNICIVGLVEKQIISLKNLMQIIDFGLKSRTTGVTGANNDSSRSHALLQIALKDQEGELHGKITFVDLAGNERAVDTIDTNKQTKIDGAAINQSLLALKECIRAMDQGKLHKPFRGSKLTLVLRDSFIGNCNTLMIANISPCLSCSEHTLNTLRYADRVKELHKEKSDRGQDEKELYEDLMMMPRQHSKTVKYEVMIKKRNTDKRLPSDNIKATTPKSNIMHINDLINTKEGKRMKHVIKNHSKSSKSNTFNYISNGSTSSNHNASFTSKKGVGSVSIYLANEFLSDTKEFQIRQSFSTSKEKKPKTKSKSSHEYISIYKDIQVNSDEDYQKYKSDHSKLVDAILQEEEEFSKFHKNHINTMKEMIQEEIHCMIEVDKEGSDIVQYTNSLSEILKKQVDKINKVRKRLIKFQNLLKDEETLASKFENEDELFNEYYLNTQKSKSLIINDES